MGEKLDRALALRVAASDIDRIDALAARFPIVTPRALARVAMRIGLDAIERDPTQLLATPIPKRGGARPRPKAKRQGGRK